MPIISHEHKFIFVKVRKVASSSIAVMLERVCSPNDIVGRMNHISKSNKKLYTSRNIVSPDGYKLEKHDSLKMLLEHKFVTEEQFSDYFKFAFERNSYDKAVSCYLYACRNRGNVSFSEYLRTFRGSDFDLYSLDGEISVDFVGQYSNFKNDLDYICKRIGIENNIEEIHEKKRKPKHNKHYSHFYNDDDIRVCSEIYRREIERFGYEFKQED